MKGTTKLLLSMRFFIKKYICKARSLQFLKTHARYTLSLKQYAKKYFLQFHVPIQVSTISLFTFSRKDSFICDSHFADCNDLRPSFSTSTVKPSAEMFFSHAAMKNKMRRRQGHGDILKQSFFLTRGFAISALSQVSPATFFFQCGKCILVWEYVSPPLAAPRGKKISPADFPRG